MEQSKYARMDLTVWLSGQYITNVTFWVNREREKSNKSPIVILGVTVF